MSLQSSEQPTQQPARPFQQPPVRQPTQPPMRQLSHPPVRQPRTGNTSSLCEDTSKVKGRKKKQSTARASSSSVAWTSSSSVGMPPPSSVGRPPTSLVGMQPASSVGRKRTRDVGFGVYTDIQSGRQVIDICILPSLIDFLTLGILNNAL